MFYHTKQSLFIAKLPRLARITVFSTGIIGMLTLASCDQNRNSATTNNSQDTTSVTKAGGPPIRDTATVSKDKRDSTTNKNNNSTAKGNADPTGKVKNQ